MASATMICPFCGFKTSDSYEISLHIEQYHIDDSPFAIEDESNTRQVPAPYSGAERDDMALALELEKAEEEAARANRGTMASHDKESMDLARALEIADAEGKAQSVDDDFPFMQCPEKDCEEFILLEDYNEHINLHAASSPSLDTELSTPIASAPSTPSTADHSQSLSTSSKSSNSPRKLVKARGHSQTSTAGTLVGLIGLSSNSRPVNRMARSSAARRLGGRRLGVSRLRIELGMPISDNLHRKRTLAPTHTKIECQPGCTNS